MKFVMNTGRTIRQGKFIEAKMKSGYGAETSTCYMHPIDLMDLGIEEGDHVLLTTEVGSVVLHVVAEINQPPGGIFVPLGPYANYIIPSGTHGTGMPDFKDIHVSLVPTEEPVVTTRDLITSLGGVCYED